MIFSKNMLNQWKTIFSKIITGKCANLLCFVLARVITVCRPYYPPAILPAPPIWYFVNRGKNSVRERSLFFLYFPKYLMFSSYFLIILCLYIKLEVYGRIYTIYRASHAETRSYFNLGISSFHYFTIGLTNIYRYWSSSLTNIWYDMNYTCEILQLFGYVRLNSQYLLHEEKWKVSKFLN
jgi:hypothetical protein